MSRIGRQEINIPSAVEIKQEEKKLFVKGPKGELEIEIPEKMAVEKTDNILKLKLLADDRKNRSLYGLYRTLIYNMVIGVTEGFSKKLELVGTGYRVNLQGNKLNFSVGYSHPVIIEPPEGISFTVEGDKEVKVSGIKKSLVGQIAANLKKIRPPEPYKGKGIRYKGEFIKTKPGKQTKGSA